VLTLARRSSVVVCFLAVALFVLQAVSANDSRFIPHSHITSTVPANGDTNPYGVAFVPKDFPGGGIISPGDVLISNFNNNGSLQGRGTTIVQFTPSGTIAPSGSANVFFTSTPVGLTTALGVLSRGFVIVGNVPTADGTAATITQGSLQVIDRNGALRDTISDATLLDSPWDLAIDDDGDHASVFVSNVISGTVTRVDLRVDQNHVTVVRKTRIAKGYATAPNAAALVLGPTGLAFDETTGVLYVASTDDNAIYAIPNAEFATGPVIKGIPVFTDSHLRGPLALVFAPNGHLLTANGDAVNADPTHPSEIVEFTKSGQFVGEYNVDSAEGGAFGMATESPTDFFFNFAAVDDNNNSLSVISLGSGSN